MKKVITLFVLLLLVAVVAVAASYSRALEEKAIMGDSEAMYQLSLCYMNGNGVAADYDKSDYWLERAAQEGQPNAVAAIRAMRGKTGLSDSKRAQLVAEEKRERERLQANCGSGNSSGGTPTTGNQTFTVNGVSFTMVQVQGGTFTMDYTSVTLSSYYIGQTEVTQELWQAVMGKNPSHFKGAKRPVENVSYKDCIKFIKNLNRLTGREFRLPTAAEWEYAASGGSSSQHYMYSGSNNIDDVAWNWDNSSHQTQNVATKRANELGIYDMSGNVWEWCQDNWYGYDSHHVDRGGSWNLKAEYCRVSRSDGHSAGTRDSSLGLRLAL